MIHRRRTPCLALGILLTVGHAHAAPTISLSTSGFSFGVGQTISVSLFATEFGQAAAPSIRSYSITLNFDPAILQATSVWFSSELDPGALGTTQNPVLGTGFATADESANAATTADALIASQSDTFVLARIDLRALAPGFGVISGGQRRAR